jgi:transposase
MSGFIERENRCQSSLFPESVDNYVEEDSVDRAIDVFIDRLDISGLGFKAEAAETGRPGYHPRTMLKIYVYGYLNRVHSSRRLGREAKRNVELMWLTFRLTPDFKTIADFRKDNGESIRLVCREFVMLFYLALLPSLVNPERISVPMVLSLFVAVIFVLSTVFVIYVFAAEKARHVMTRKQSVQKFNRMTATALDGAAIWIATR